MRRLALFLTALGVALAGSIAHADDRPGLPLPEPSQGEVCFEVFFEDVSETVCIPAPS
jgi:hypothetical protein